MSKCLLFDCDGTLVDSERLCHIALVRKFRELGIDLDVDDLVMRFRGWKLASLLEQLCAENTIELPATFVPSYRALTAELFAQQLRPVAGVRAALEQLDHPMAVVSNGPLAKITQTLSFCGLSHYFDGRIYSAYATGFWKPDPRAFTHAAADMGYAPEQCIVIDDGLIGVEAGVQAGMRTLFFNQYDEPCPYPQVESFSSMAALSALVGRELEA